MRKTRKRFVLFLIVVVIAIVCYARYIEPELLIVREVTVKTTMDIKECKVVFFSDTHFGMLYREEHVKKLVDRINELQADIVIFGGDLIDDYERDQQQLDMEYLQKEMVRIEAKEGKYAVFGNHDYGGGAFRIYEKFMTDCGFKVLVNESVVLEKYNIEVMGLDDYLFGQPNFSAYPKSDWFCLVAAHEPVVSKFVDGLEESLVVTGHTHGGQVSIPYFTQKQLPTGCDQFVKGFYTALDIGVQRSVQMYVSSGIGLTKYPLRFGNIPEIIEINLKKEN